MNFIVKYLYLYKSGITNLYYVQVSVQDQNMQKISGEAFCVIKTMKKMKRFHQSDLYGLKTISHAFKHYLIKHFNLFKVAF